MARTIHRIVTLISQTLFGTSLKINNGKSFFKYSNRKFLDDVTFDLCLLRDKMQLVQISE